MTREITICVVFAVIVSGCRTPSRPMVEVDTLQTAVEQLRTKTIHEAYFWLLSPQLPAGPHVFAPDTKGGAYVLIARDTLLPADVEPASLRAEFEKNWDAAASRYAAGPPRIDEKARRVIYYSQSEWDRLIKVVKRWTVDQTAGPPLFQAEQQRGQRYLTIRIPKANQAQFLRTLIEEGLGHDRPSFTYEIGWN